MSVSVSRINGKPGTKNEVLGAKLSVSSHFILVPLTWYLEPITQEQTAPAFAEAVVHLIEF